MSNIDLSLENLQTRLEFIRVQKIF